MPRTRARSLLSNATTGEILWCKEMHRSIAGGSVEVDSDGKLYVTAEAKVYSYEPNGDLRWQQVLDNGDGSDQAYRTFGLHFSPSGFLVTVTLPGIVSVIDRANGNIVAQFDIAEEYNFVAPTPRLPDSIDLLNFSLKHLLTTSSPHSGRERPPMRHLVIF